MKKLLSPIYEVLMTDYKVVVSMDCGGQYWIEYFYPDGEYWIIQC